MPPRIEFTAWKREVDRIMQALCGLTADDIDDWRYSADYEEGRSPGASARRAIKNAGGPA